MTVAMELSESPNDVHQILHIELMDYLHRPGSDEAKELAVIDVHRSVCPGSVCQILRVG